MHIYRCKYFLSINMYIEHKRTRKTGMTALYCSSKHAMYTFLLLASLYSCGGAGEDILGVASVVELMTAYDASESVMPVGGNSIPL